MKKYLLFAFFLFCTSVFAFADEGQIDKKFAIGVGPEFNMNSRDNFAAGVSLNIDYALPLSFARLSVGLLFTASYNFDEIIVLEPAVSIRWYFLGTNGAGWFVQAEGGAYLVLEAEDITPLFLGGIRAGFRLPLSDMFFIEPFGRLGYPFMFGIGFLAGIRF